MSDCIDCNSYDEENSCCTSNGKSPIRKCINEIIRNYCTQDLNNKNILEIGYGRNRYFRRNVKEEGGRWFGLDPHTCGATHKGVAKDAGEIFDELFDIIYAGQTMEHWRSDEKVAENIKSLHSVLKDGGWLYINVPIYSHGNKMFVLYDEKKILECLNICSWEKIEFERWRYNYASLAPFNPFRKKFAKKLSVISSQETPSIWVLEIRLKK